SRRWSRLLAGGAVLACVAAAALGVVWARGHGPEARWRAVEEAIAGQRWDEARYRLAHWLDRSPDDGKARLMYGGVLDVLGRRDEASAAFRAVGASDPNWPRARSFLGESALKRHDAAEAERAFRSAASADPTAIDPRRRLV